MKAERVLLAWLAFFVLCPVLDIGGHFVYLPELFLYVLFLSRIPRFMLQRSAAARGGQGPGIHYRRAMRAHLVYAMLFVATVVVTARLAGQGINNYDVFVLRNLVQVILCLKLFEELLRAIDPGRHERTLFGIIIVLCVPALLVYLQRLDLLGAREIVNVLYKPQFFFLGREEFSSYRYTAVFKDFFTAAVYFTLLASFIFYFVLSSSLGVARRAVLMLLFAFVYAAQLFVARTSLVMIPIIAAAIVVFASPKLPILARRLLPIAVPLGLIALVGAQYLLQSGLVNSDWVMEALVIFSPGDQHQSSSFDMMQQWYREMFSHAVKGEYSLWSPSHIYDLTEVTDPGIYTDSFYGQELYRYGIYGAIAYVMYLLLVLHASLRGARLVALLVIALAIMNYKGGNTFLMAKTLYLYAFLLAAIPHAARLTIAAHAGDQLDTHVAAQPVNVPAMRPGNLMS